MLLNGFGFSGYRSIGKTLAKIGPLKKINVIIGANNSGKSNILYYLHKHYSKVLSRIQNPNGESPNFTDIDKPISSEPIKSIISFPLYDDDSSYNDHIYQSITKKHFDETYKDLIDRILKSEYFIDQNNISWITYQADDLNGRYKVKFKGTELESILSESDWNRLWTKLTKLTGGGLTTHWIPQVIEKLTKINIAPPKVEFIPAIRKIGDANTAPDDYSGLGIIERLAKIQNPDSNQQDLKEKFRLINYFLKIVLENPTAQLEIPFKRDTILVHMDGKTLPISSLGTGVHEVVILAAAATILENTILCIEEPELHLHPLLQGKLISYLLNNTNNQYLFTTHSAHLIDNPGIQVFHVNYQNGETIVSLVKSSKKRFEVCADLGYKASDIVQSNCVIWVEGPSDRIYINYWLNDTDSTLIEGVHYSIMFYGGRLFSHLSGLDTDDIDFTVDDLISLRRLNQNSCIVFDSDRTRSGEIMSHTKLRLKKEFESENGFVWVSDGKEIENYINPDDIRSCIQNVHPKAERFIGSGQFDNLLKYRIRGGRKDKIANKVKVSRYYISQFSPDLSIYNLKKQLNGLRKYIYFANNLKINQNDN